ncbi:MAG: LLM class flavin-dependent oxidoreductase [Bifidobacteriaceae bacterium]|nr:LLM class flavin-dependent oxidoreductase [Bifidobacteriaceae bacterium]
MSKPKTNPRRMFLGSELVGGVARIPNRVDLEDDDSDRSPRVPDLGEAARLARLAQRGVLDYISIDDALAGNPAFSGRRRGGLDAIRLASRLAPATEGIFLVPLVRASWVEPSNLIEALIDLEAASGGRHGWELQLHDNHSPMEHSGQLLSAIVDDTWSDAEPLTRLAAQARALRKRRTDWNASPGHASAASGQPVHVMRADTPESAALAAARADVARLTVRNQDDALAKRQSLRQATADCGRPADALKVLIDLTLVLAHDQSHAEARRDLAEEITGRRLGGPGIRFVGTPTALAEACVDWVDSGACDGFTFLPTSLPVDLAMVVREVTPVLTAAGRLPTSYRERQPGRAPRSPRAIPLPRPRGAAPTRFRHGRRVGVGAA